MLGRLMWIVRHTVVHDGIRRVSTGEKASATRSTAGRMAVLRWRSDLDRPPVARIRARKITSGAAVTLLPVMVRGQDEVIRGVADQALRFIRSRRKKLTSLTHHSMAVNPFLNPMVMEAQWL